MSEKKGFFGKLFGGRKDKAPQQDVVQDIETTEFKNIEEAVPVVADTVTDAVVESTTPELIAPEEIAIEEIVVEEIVVEELISDEIIPEEINPVEFIEPTTETIEPAPQEIAPEEVLQEATSKKGFFARLTEGLSRSSQKLSDGVTGIFRSAKLDDDTLEELEDLLISSDLGLGATTRIISQLTKDKFDKQVTGDEIRRAVADEIYDTLLDLERPVAFNTPHKPHVILMTGVNGAGKTTTIGKMAQKYANDGKSVMLAAGDTFRAAAIEQLTVWGERTGAPVITRGVGADAAALAFDAYQEAIEKNIDILMIDTAGRLQNRTELMDELAKVVRVIQKVDASAPHDTILVLDATVGQNALSQTEVFRDIAGVSGLVMTKLDGTARGGVLVALADKFALPIHFIGIGESVEDLQRFDALNYSHAIVGLDKD